MSKINIPNLITSVRLFFIIPFIHFFSNNQIFYAIIVLLLFALLDILDGFVARKFNRVTTFGKNFDIVTDIIFGAVIVISMLLTHMIPSLYLFLILLPAILYTFTFFFGFFKAGYFFIYPKWKEINATFFFASMLLLLLNTNVSIVIAYILLIYFYVASFRYMFEIRVALKQSRYQRKK